MHTTDKSIILAPFDESLPPERRTAIAISMSELVIEMVTHVICHTLVDYREQLQANSRLTVAHAFLQRATSTHLCNHKLTAEGITLSYKGQPFELHEEFKTMTLTRSVYEHLAMFYFLFEHPHSDEERDIVWKYWQINSKKNLLDGTADTIGTTDQARSSLVSEIENLRSQILATPIGQQCHQKLGRWTDISTPASNGSIEFELTEGRYSVRRVSYSQAWRYLFNNDDMALFYRHLSMHCHPVYEGLVQYQSQSESDEGTDAIPLYFSCSFLAQLCSLFLRQIPKGKSLLKTEFSKHQQQLFNALAQLTHEQQS